MRREAKQWMGASLWCVAFCAMAAAPGAWATKAAPVHEEGITKFMPGLYASKGPTSSAAVGDYLSTALVSVPKVKLYVNTHGMGATTKTHHQGSPWGAGVGTCPAIEWSAQSYPKAKPVLLNMQDKFNASHVADSKIVEHDKLLMAQIIEDMVTNSSTVVLGWCYGFEYLEYLDATYQFKAQVRKALGGQ